MCNIKRLKCINLNLFIINNLYGIVCVILLIFVDSIFCGFSDFVVLIVFSWYRVIVNLV